MYYQVECSLKKYNEINKMYANNIINDDAMNKKIIGYLHLTQKKHFDFMVTEKKIRSFDTFKNNLYFDKNNA